MVENPLEKLNCGNAPERLNALRDLKNEMDMRDFDSRAKGNDVNSHIHTIYSFSPYSPTAAVYKSFEAGLVTTGIMDHDSISGAKEFIEAGKIMGIPTTIGAELRVDFSGTRLEGRKINNPDQETVAYVAMHGVPHNRIDELSKFFEPVSINRGIRNRKMTGKINNLLKSSGIEIDYDKDVIPLSMSLEGGSVTERHLLFAVAKKITSRYGKGPEVVKFLSDVLGINVTGSSREHLCDSGNIIYEYDLLNVLKGNMVEQFYIPATNEALDVLTVSRFAEENGIILAYAYLGDVTESVTGDKKAQKFEDDFLDDVFETIYEYGFKSVTYMPSRNTKGQLERLRGLCDKFGFFQISGEDINQPRQKFVCEAMRSPEFANLYDSAWALIGHEWLASENLSSGMFSGETMAKMPSIAQRTEFFKNYAQKRFSKK